MVKKNLHLSGVMIHTFMIFVAVITIMPFVLAITSSLTHERDIFISGYSFFPSMGFTTAAYEFIFRNPSQLLRSLFISVSSTAIGTILGTSITLALGYTLTRKDYPLRKPIAFYVFFTMIFNGGIVPYYIMIAGTFGLLNTFWVLLIPFLCNAFFVLLAKGMMGSVPAEIVESAKIDGANEFGIYSKVILPISKPAIATVGLFIAISYWNDWMTSLYFINSPRLFTLQYSLVRISQNIQNMALEMQFSGGAFQAMDTPMYTARMAMGVLVTLPILCVFPFIQKYFEKGIVIGSVKG